MKKGFLILVGIIIFSYTNAQYIKTLTNNSTWYQYYYFEFSMNGIYSVTGDSIINDTVYKVIRYDYYDPSPNGAGEKFFREDTVSEKIWEYMGVDGEFLWYDYSLNVADTFWFPHDLWGGEPNHTILDSITNNLTVYLPLLNHHVNIDLPERRVYYFSHPEAYYRDWIWIEGIGSIKGFGNEGDYYNHNLLCHYDSSGTLDLHINIDSTCYGPILGIEENIPFEDNSFVYPNPAKEIINVDHESFIKLEMYSLTGKKVIETLSNSLNINHLQDGIYFIRIYSKDGIENKKIIKKN